MCIFVDENIFVVDVFFVDQGFICCLFGCVIDCVVLVEVDVLLVCLVIEVSCVVLVGLLVCFVGICIIGIDYFDFDYFVEVGIVWFSVFGCNVCGVVDYVFGCLLVMVEVCGVDLVECIYGVVGVGQVGGWLVEVLCGLGWKVLVCDLLCQVCELDGEFVLLEWLLVEVDVISLYILLNCDGEYLICYLLDEFCLVVLCFGIWLVNVSCGVVVDNQVLCCLFEGGVDLEVVLDVWEGELQVDFELVVCCLIVMLYIVGYSLEGKLCGIVQIYQVYCVWCGIVECVSL